MSRARAALISFAAAIFSLAAFAQKGTATLTADEIIARHLAAEGGAAKLKAQNTMRITGYAESPGFRAEFTESKKRPNRLRRELRVSNSAMVEAYDGEMGWQLMPGKSAAEPIQGSDLKRLQEDVDFDGPLVDYRSKGNNIEMVGKEKFAGIDVYTLRVTLSTGVVRNYYVNAGNYLGAGLAGKTLSLDKETEFEITLDDFREVNGIKLPFKAQHHSRSDAGEVTLTFTFASVELNVPMDDSLFKMPETSTGRAPEATASR